MHAYAGVEMFLGSETYFCTGSIFCSETHPVMAVLCNAEMLRALHEAETSSSWGGVRMLTKILKIVSSAVSLVEPLFNLS